MRLSFITLALLLFQTLGSPASPEELPAPVLHLIKDRTVMITTGGSPPELKGSGVLYESTNDHAYIITNAHVIAPMSTINVVQNAGEQNEKVKEARVLGIDDHNDLAILAIPFPEWGRLPRLEPRQAMESSVVFAAGHRFGNTPAANNRNSKVTVSPGQVSSIKRDSKAEPTLIQLNIAVDPGNSGGPVFDGSGSFLGIATTRITGTLTGLIIPATKVHKFMKGFVTDIKVRKKQQQEDRLIINLTATLCNPTNQIKFVRVYLATRKKEAKTNASDLPISTSKQELKIRGDRALSDFALPAQSDAVYLFQTECTYIDGETKLGPIKEFSLASLETTEAAPMASQAATPPGDWLGTAKTPTLTSKETDRSTLGPSTASHGLRVTTLIFQSETPQIEITWSKDHRHFYTLEKAGSIRKISFPDMKEERVIHLNTEDLMLSNSQEGLILFSRALRELWVFDEETLTRKRVIKNVEATTVAASVNSLLVFCTTEPNGTLCAIDLESGGFLKERITKGEPPIEVQFNTLAFAPNGRILLATDGSELCQFRVENKQLLRQRSSPIYGHTAIKISPDSRYCLHSNGIYSLDEMTRPIIRTSERLSDIAFDQTNKRLFYRTPHRFLELAVIDLNTGKEKIISLNSQHDGRSVAKRAGPNHVLELHPGGNDILATAGSTVLWIQITNPDELFR